MKRIIFLALALLIAQYAFAQMDERFYHPDKVEVPITYSTYEELCLPVESDTVYTLILQPAKPVKATILYFTATAAAHPSGWNT